MLELKCRVAKGTRQKHPEGNLQEAECAMAAENSQGLCPKE